MQSLNTNGKFNVSDVIQFSPFRVKHLLCHFICVGSLLHFPCISSSGGPFRFIVNSKNKNFCAFSGTSRTGYVVEMVTFQTYAVHPSCCRSLSPCSCIPTSRLISYSQYTTSYIIICMILHKFVFVQLLLLLLLPIVIIWIYFCCTVVFLCSPLPFLFLI
jgi:hypothetical protein